MVLCWCPCYKIAHNVLSISCKKNWQFKSQVLADMLSRETLLWKLQMLKAASASASSHLHAVKVQALLLCRSLISHQHHPLLLYLLIFLANILAKFMASIVIMADIFYFFVIVERTSCFPVKTKPKDFAACCQNVRYVCLKKAGIFSS